MTTPRPRILWISVTLALACALALACDGDVFVAISAGGNIPAPPLTVLALGDSYTIGEGVRVGHSWPAQLADSLAARGIEVEGVTYIARTGWTTTSLLAAIDSVRAGGEVAATYDLVTVQIGVNNQFGQLDVDLYIDEFEQVLDEALAFAGGDAAGVIVLSLPDYGVTPVGHRFGPERIAEEIDHYNRINRGFAREAGTAYADITPLSREAAGDPTLVARDGLHFSGKMYARWVSLLLPLVDAE